MSSLFVFLIVVQALIAAALVGIILMQRSEGGGLGVGGNPTGLMSARGAADFLTRATKWLAVVFVVLSIVLAALAAESGNSSTSLDSTLNRSAPEEAPAAPTSPAPAPANNNDPLSGVAG